MKNVKQGLSLLMVALATAAAFAGAPSDASAQRSRRAPAAEAPVGSSEGVVNIQTASLDQLQLLPGIGPSKAQAIVAQREQRAFRSVEDIMRVRGIGRATFRRLRPMLTVEGPTTLTAQPHTPRARPAQEEVEQ